MFEMKNIEAKTMALNHKIALLRKRNLHLHRQKNEFQTKIHTSKQQKLMSDWYDVPKSFFEEEFGEDNKTA
ncbi:hypothetical protein DPMN_016716 [Dreissena polymorpha]|uniref:Uncharacterized protein n=1 Tax=Dreissena polymorpha TaxID=45954 RepID=A0A9D4NBS4_DREPO|nr:hypothetical protein DPMN_016716 [Dreissena polymorpha]